MVLEEVLLVIEKLTMLLVQVPEAITDFLGSQRAARGRSDSLCGGFRGPEDVPGVLEDVPVILEKVPRGLKQPPEAVGL